MGDVGTPGSPTSTAATEVIVVHDPMQVIPHGTIHDPHFGMVPPRQAWPAGASTPDAHAKFGESQVPKAKPPPLNLDLSLNPNLPENRWAGGRTPGRRGRRHRALAGTLHVLMLAWVRQGWEHRADWEAACRRPRTNVLAAAWHARQTPKAPTPKPHPEGVGRPRLEPQVKRRWSTRRASLVKKEMRQFDNPRAACGGQRRSDNRRGDARDAWPQSAQAEAQDVLSANSRARRPRPQQSRRLCRTSSRGCAWTP